MTREEAISVLEESKRQNEIMRDNPNTFFKVSDIVTGEKNAQKRIDALNMAISALRQQEQQPNDPLTMDELRQMDGEPVYIVENTEYWAIVNSFDQAGVYLLSYGNPDDYGYFGLYGKTWLAYRQKPEEGTE